MSAESTIPQTIANPHEMRSCKTIEKIETCECPYRGVLKTRSHARLFVSGWSFWYHYSGVARGGAVVHPRVAGGVPGGAQTPPDGQRQTQCLTSYCVYLVLKTPL